MSASLEAPAYPAVEGPRFDLPTPDEATQPWWDACREHKLLIQRCNGCGKAQLYPRPFCATCWAEDLSWEQASGRATLYTWSVVYANDLPPFGPRVPYVAAIVDLEEGPRIMTNLYDVELDAIEGGMALTVGFRTETDTITLPVFRPV
jgi:uncharacterized OB-fold protein